MPGKPGAAVKPSVTRKSKSMVALPKKFVLNVEKKLSPREGQVLIELAGGATWKQAADNLKISEHRVRDCVENIRRKLRVQNTPAAVLVLSL